MHVSCTVGDFFKKTWFVDYLIVQVTAKIDSQGRV